MYDPGLAASLARTLALLLSDRMYPRAQVVVANTLRQRQTLEAFAEALHRNSISWAPLWPAAEEHQDKFCAYPETELSARVPQLFAYERPQELILWACKRA